MCSLSSELKKYHAIFCKNREIQCLIAQNRWFRFKLEFKAERVYLKMVHAIAVNQFTAAYLIEFNAELRRCNWP